MFEHLRPYKNILVSGMQRSGTTICMRMIQYDLDIPKCYWTGDIRNRIKRIIESDEFDFQKVVHSPGNSRMLGEFSSEEAVVVWVRRDLEDVIKSAQRIRWTPTRKLLLAYDIDITKGLNPEEKLRALYHAKEKYWEEVQKSEIKNWFEVDYTSLREHRLWVESPGREGFKGTRQTSPQGVRGYAKGWKKGSLHGLLQEFPKGK